MDIIKRFFHVPAGSFFVFGPRGTGKSTWIREALLPAVILDLLQPERYAEFMGSPERLRDYVLPQPEGAVVLIDEVQKVPELMSVVHELIEMHRGWRFVLTGSSARKLKRSGADLLAGRAALRHMHPFMAAELGAAFSLDYALRYGMIPVISQALSPQDAQAAYIGVYLREEVLQEGIVRNLDQFSRFLKMLSFSQASILTVTNLAREAHVNRKVVEGYLQILEDLLLGFKIPVFVKRASRAMTAHPKFYYFDCGVFRALRPKGPLDRPEEIDGLALETLVAQHLRAWCDSGGEDLFFWRTSQHHEVDFVVYGPRVFVGIEVKNSDRIREADLRSLMLFLQDYPEAKGLFLYRGTYRKQIGAVLCMPVTEFLLGLSPDIFPSIIGIEDRPNSALHMSL